MTPDPSTIDTTTEKPGVMSTIDTSGEKGVTPDIDTTGENDGPDQTRSTRIASSSIDRLLTRKQLCATLQITPRREAELRNDTVDPMPVIVFSPRNLRYDLEEVRAWWEKGRERREKENRERATAARRKGRRGRNRRS